MSKSFNALEKAFLSRFLAHLFVLCALTCLTEGRPKTLKNCGRRDTEMGRIVGGKHVQPGDYPWQISLHMKERYVFEHFCGGTILNEHYIVTAAHCIFYPEKPSMYEIYTGLHELSKRHRKPAKKYKISEIIVHEDYSEDGNSVYNDIALLRTKEPIRFDNPYVNGICLPYSKEEPTGWAIATGWGYTDEMGYEAPDVLHEVKVPLVPIKECLTTYGFDLVNDSFILDSQICAGIITRDSCQGDSGGPLVQRNKRGIYTLIGITSYGNGCGQKTYPGFYTNVAYYMDWLEQNMD